MLRHILCRTLLLQGSPTNAESRGNIHKCKNLRVTILSSRCTYIELWADGISGNLWAPKLRHLEIHTAGLIDYKMFKQCRNVETLVLSTRDIKSSQEVGRVDLRGCDPACFARLKHININAMTLTERNVFSRLNAHRIEVFKLVVHDTDESQFSSEGLRQESFRLSTLEVKSRCLKIELCK